MEKVGRVSDNVNYLIELFDEVGVEKTKEDRVGTRRGDADHVTDHKG